MNEKQIKAIDLFLAINREYAKGDSVDNAVIADLEKQYGVACVEANLHDTEIYDYCYQENLM